MMCKYHIVRLLMGETLHIFLLLINSLSVLVKTIYRIIDHKTLFDNIFQNMQNRFLNSCFLNNERP